MNINSRGHFIHHIAPFRSAALLAAAFILLAAAVVLPPPFGQTPEALAQAGDMVKIPYGKDAGQIGASRVSGEVIIRNPRALAYDGIDAFYIADALNKKIIKVSLSGLRISDQLSFAKSPVEGPAIKDMAAIGGAFYLLTAKGLYKLSADGGKCDLIAKTGDKETVRRPGFVFADGAGNLSLTDEHYEGPQIVSFDKNGKAARTVKLKPGAEEYYSYASDGAHKFYANNITPDGFEVFAAGDPKNVILRYKKDQAEKLQIFFAHFIGFDASKNLYCHVAYSEADGPVTANFIYKFDRAGKLLNKAALPLPEEDEIALAKPFMIVKEDEVVSYREAEDGFILTKAEFK